MTSLYFASWGLLLYVTFLINHFDLFGLQQVTYELLQKEIPRQKFVTHLLFAIVTTAYILVGIQLEERDLADTHPEYAQYKRKVPALLPSLRRRLSRSSEIQIA